MSTNESIRYGIDLGTTNSSIAILQGDRVIVVPSKFNHESTPSAVAFWHAEGHLETEVGQRARTLMFRPGVRVAREFKEHMGEPNVLFDGADPPERPHELSARVLRELVSSLGLRSGLPPLHAAVVTVPAAFKNPARDDTKRAAELAGIGHVELFPEPAAAGLAYGRNTPVAGSLVWLAYDLGGGTFDAAIVRAEDGVFTVIDNEGDRQLGGKHLDELILRELVLPKLPSPLREQTKFKSLPWEMLKDLVEDAKCALSVQESATVQGEILHQNVSVRLARADVDRLQARLFGRTLKICRALLARNGFETRHIERCIVVGGPMLSPFMRDFIRNGHADAAHDIRIEGLGIDIDTSVDPMTAVAQGAAIRAAAQRIPTEAMTRIRATAPHTQIAVGVSVRVSSQVQEEDVMVAGALGALRPDVAVTRDWAVVFERLDGARSVTWRSDPLPVSDAGKFVGRAALLPGHNQFEVRVLDGRRTTVEADDGRRFEVMRGIVTGELTLGRGFGVADENGNTVWFFRKGEGLNRRVSKSFTTTVALERGSSLAAVVIPVVEGFDDKASLNREVYTMRIAADEVGLSIPAGAFVDVDLLIDESQQLHLTATFKDYPVKAQAANTCIALDRRRVAEPLRLLERDLALFRQVKDSSPAIAAVIDEVDDGDLVGNINEMLDLGTPQHPAPWDQAADRVIELSRMIDLHRAEADDLLAWQAHKAHCDENVNKAKRIVEKTVGLSRAWLDEFARLCKEYDEACILRDREQAQHIAYGLVPAHFESNDKLKDDVGGGPVGVAAGERTSEGLSHKGTIRQA